MLRLSPSLSHCFLMQTVHLAQRALKRAALLMQQALLFGLHKSLLSLRNCALLSFGSTACWLVFSCCCVFMLNCELVRFSSHLGNVQFLKFKHFRLISNSKANFQRLPSYYFKCLANQMVPAVPRGSLGFLWAPSSSDSPGVTPSTT